MEWLGSNALTNDSDEIEVAAEGRAAKSNVGRLCSTWSDRRSEDKVVAGQSEI